MQPLRLTVVSHINLGDNLIGFLTVDQFMLVVGTGLALIIVILWVIFILALFAWWISRHRIHSIVWWLSLAFGAVPLLVHRKYSRLWCVSLAFG